MNKLLLIVIHTLLYALYLMNLKVSWKSQFYVQIACVTLEFLYYLCP